MGFDIAKRVLVTLFDRVHVLILVLFSVHPDGRFEGAGE